MNKLLRTIGVTKLGVFLNTFSFPFEPGTKRVIFKNIFQGPSEPQTVDIKK